MMKTAAWNTRRWGSWPLACAVEGTTFCGDPVCHALDIGDQLMRERLLRLAAHPGDRCHDQVGEIYVKQWVATDRRLLGQHIDARAPAMVPFRKCRDERVPIDNRATRAVDQDRLRLRRRVPRRRSTRAFPP